MIGCVSSIYEPLLIVEYCANGDLLTLLRRHKDYILVDPEADCPAQADFCLSIKDLLSFSWQISDGLVYLSSKNFIHRDIACRNVLITKRMVAKISDFGLCRYSQEALYTTKVGKLPIKWMAIEALKLAEFTSKSDVWSYGVLLFELFSVGDTPYPSISPSDMLDFLLQGNRLPKPELCPEELYNMMQTMWDLNPDSRPTFEIIRKNLSAFLEVSSDAYGYIQVSQDYGKFYSKMEFPLKSVEDTLEVVDESEHNILKPITDSGILIQQINENIGKKDEKDIIENIDNVNGETEAEDDSKTPLLQKKENEPSTSEECKAAGEVTTCHSMEQLLKDYFTAKGCDSNPKLEVAKQRLRHQLKNTIHNFEQACEERNRQEQQQQNIPAPPQYPIFQFNPNFQQRFNNPMLNPMFRQQQQIRQMQMQMMQPPIIQQQQQQPHPPPFTRPQRFQNQQRFNFRQRPPFLPPSQNSYFFPPPPSL
uniref:Protein kinase domain-containing protein n=1 Tax=Panagrolaimus sp. PS1159 TaxID=55785 RepID=A0AC35G6W0_9BILA